MSTVEATDENLFRFYLNDVYYIPSYDAIDAYFAEKKFIKTETLSDKTHLYEMGSSYNTKIIKKDEIIKVIANKINKDLSCKEEEILQAIGNANFPNAHTAVGSLLEPINVYDSKSNTIGTVVYSFTGVNDVSTPPKQQHIAGVIKDNIQKAITATSADVEKALDATKDKKFKAGSPLKNIPISYNGQPLGTTEYLFNSDTDLTYKASKTRKDVIDTVVEKVNTKHQNTFYTTYEKVDEILPEKVEGKSKGDKQTKLDVPLYAIEEKYEKLNAAGMGDTVYIVVKTIAPRGVRLKVSIYEKESLLEVANAPLSIISKANEDTITTCELESSVFNVVSDGEGTALLKVTLRPSETKMDTWREKFKPVEARKEIIDKLWLNVEGKQEFLKGDEFELNSNTCFCNRDFTIDELKVIVEKLRKSESINSTDLFSSSKSPLQVSDRTYERFTEELNKAMKKYSINTCLRKSHFIAQTYHETDRFRTTKEYNSGNTGSYDPYRGRGLMQLTWENNYKIYKAYSGTECLTNYETIAENLFNSIDSACWFWKQGKQLSQTAVWSAPSSAPTYVKSKNPSYKKDIISYKDGAVTKKYGTINMNLIADDDYVDVISWLVNGGSNGLTERRNYLKRLKEIFKYESICKNKK